MKIVNITVLAACLLFGYQTEVFAAGNCFQCHSRQGFTKKFVHEPATREQCRECHNPHVSKHKGLLADEKTALCYGCHQELKETLEAAKVTHNPFAGGDCLACHDPHSSTKKGLIRESEAGSVCFECHEELANKYKNRHRPFASGNCQACHNPHVADRIQLLVDDPDRLCVSCHRAEIEASHKKFSYKVKEKGCLTCHNPHGSDSAGLMRKVLHAPYQEGCGECHGKGGIAGVEKCLECHDELGEKLSSIHGHLTSKGPNGCTNCHSPHASDYNNMLRNRQSQVCRKCHSDTWDAYIDKPYKHPDSEVCGNCHEPHGSNNPVLLKNDGNATCSNCHETQGTFTHPVGPGVIDKRNGQIMTCVSCHYPHGTIFQANLKLSGAMELCIECHKNY
jgi:predicted CXXCH cytochrome family protein